MTLAYKRAATRERIVALLNGARHERHPHADLGQEHEEERHADRALTPSERDHLLRSSLPLPLPLAHVTKCSSSSIVRDVCLEANLWQIGEEGSDGQSDTDDDRYR